MRPTDRARLTTVLRDHVARIATDLRGQLRPPGPARERAQKLWTDEQVGEDFDVWTDLLSRRAAVLWVLKSVYVRVLEDKGLLSPGRLLDPESQQLFEKLAPNLGESAFLRWVYRDLGSARGGLPELFAPQPAEVATPSDENSRALIEFWRHRDADSGVHWSFAEERFEGELMGDLYQELDPIVKDRFALCQTPDFVRAFILDRTLTPAMETFGADTVRLLDPACGSGHFLIDGLKRLVAATTEKHKEWEKKELVRHCLNRVVGIDLNDYACALARARLVMTAAELAGVSSLAEASVFHPHVYWADGLEQVEKGQDTRGHQLSLLEPAQNETPRASLSRPEVRAALGAVVEPKFHAVVANPPYITEKDEARKEYHREKVGKRRRYISAYREYSLAGPFTERCFQCALSQGYVGLITSNNFMKREFGKPLIQDVLTTLDLTLLVDASHAAIPFHTTPTVMLFGCNRQPVGEAVRTVMGRRGETGIPIDPTKGLVWCSIDEHWNHPGFENEYITVTSVPRTTLAKHPWSLGGGGAAELRGQLEAKAIARLGELAEIGTGAVTREDDVYLVGRSAALRMGVPCGQIRPLVEGDVVRDWSISGPVEAIWPYEPDLLEAVTGSAEALVSRALWRWRTQLAQRVAYGKSQLEHGLKWFEYSMFFVNRFRTPLSIVFAFVATHNHFVLDRGGKVFKQSALLIKLPATASEDDHLALLGLLNSSMACFWMKQVFYPKGSATSDISKDGLTPENNRYEFAATGMLSFPLAQGWRDERIIRRASRLQILAQERASIAPASLLADESLAADAHTLRSALADAEKRDSDLFHRMVFQQEELDWLVYGIYGLLTADIEECGTEFPLDPLWRPFVQAHNPSTMSVPAEVTSLYKKRREQILLSPALGLIETVINKRLWRGTQGVFGRYDRTYMERAQTAMRAWFAERLEAIASARGRTFTIEQTVAALQDDRRTLAVAEVLAGRPDFNLSQLIRDAFQHDCIPNHRFHIYKDAGVDKRAVWERTWDDQRREDAGEKVTLEVPPQYAPGDFLRSEYWQLRGKLDVPKERFIAFTEVPGRDANNTLYGWAGWTPVQRLKALLSIDEELEDAGIPLTDRIGVLDSAWRLLPDVAREDAAMANRLKAELQALVGTDGPSREQLDDWRQRFPPPGTKAARAAGQTAKKKKS